MEGPLRRYELVAPSSELKHAHLWATALRPQGAA